ncbi:MAG: LytTR family transcriptional regulator DNA-binding domain-containing protein [Prolixibacteraceae bacterium]|jgi:two-component system LytT family response regulator|nr:LytTR family transcriptional regulator DNA-binding domain-containing protein [Prolixibacteraceae bacterium]
MKTYRTIIIDDEAIARQRLTTLLKEFQGQFEIVGEAKNGIEGAEMINILKPDLIFLDIQMPGKTGFEMLEMLEHVPQVVFCTAYEEFALKAFSTLALDYLVKPVEVDRLQLTLDKLNRNSTENSGLQVQQLLDLVRNHSDKKKMQSIPHKIGDRVLLIKTEKITHFCATDKYVEFFTNDGKKYLTELSLKKLTDRLPNNFKQVQRSIIVNVNFVKEYRKYFRGKYILLLDDLNNTKLETGRSYTDELKELMAIE